MAKILTFAPEKSEHVEHLAYDPETEQLRIRFRNKANKEAKPRSYTHGGVPANVFAAMTRQPSVGKYYHNVIKRHYRMV